MQTKKRAFTLVELLVVIAIIAIVSAASILSVSIGSGKQALIAGQQALISVFEEAKLVANGKNARARVLIYKGDDASRKFRQVGIIYEYFDKYGNSVGWVSHSSGAMLPKGVFFVPPSGEGDADLEIQEPYKKTDLPRSTFRNGTTGAPAAVSMPNFGSVRPQIVGENNGDWYCYEFSPEGLSENPGATIVVAPGSVLPSGKYLVENPYMVMGFRIVKSGKTVPFSDATDIEGTTKR